MPKVKFASIKNYYKVEYNDIEEGEGSEKFFEFPLHLLPNTSIKIFAQLEFPNTEERDKSIIDGQIHFNIMIKHSKGNIDKRI